MGWCYCCCCVWLAAAVVQLMNQLVEPAGASGHMWSVMAVEAARVMVAMEWLVEPAGSNWQRLSAGWRWDAPLEQVAVVEA